MSAPFRSRRIPLRQLVLFVLSMVVPCLVVLGLGARMVVQQEELAEKHAADERRLRATEFERSLLAALERARRDPSDPTVAMSALLEGTRLVLPWDSATRADPVDAQEFGAMIARAEHDEFVTSRLAAAATALDDALAAATSSQQRAYARLLRARVFVKAHRLEEATGEYRLLLAEPLSTMDQDGVPFALYAADRLLTLSGDTDRKEIERVVAEAVDGAANLPPAAWYLLRAISNGNQAVSLRIADVEHAMAVQRDMDTLIAQWKGADGVWLPHGTPLWLVSKNDRTVIAVRAPRPVVSGSDGELLGPRFPGVSVILSSEDAAAPRRQRRAFYAAALAIVLGVALFGGYLLWRDVNREMRLAALRSQFVSSVSHELRTPLTAIRMFAETLQLDRVDARTRAEYLETIVNESERLTRLLNNVLDFSKIEEGRKVYRREEISLPKIVRTAARAIAYPLEQQGFVLAVKVDESLPLVDADADALQQAILNLLTNAMKYSGSGRTIELRLGRDRHHAVIAVTDQGIGIAPGDQARIFEKFYRVATPENERIAGTGLGLTLVEHIVTSHGGSIRVDSAPGRGSVFAIHLPIATDDAPVLAVEAAS